MRSSWALAYPAQPAFRPAGEVTLDLVRQLAAATGGDAGPDPQAWFLETFKKPADYSDLLGQLFKVPAERQQRLKAYFAPTADEREQGLKAPTAAHHAAADLMARGYVRVVVTTNFDRLLEQALEAKGITPVVVSNADQVRGMLPLTHQSCCVIKVHGDYLDTRIMNTTAELEAYSPEMNGLLDRVFDEFGLVVCGWSGAWDPALRAAITRGTIPTLRQLLGQSDAPWTALPAGWPTTAPSRRSSSRTPTISSPTFPIASSRSTT